jgi:hypothetical protein
MKNHILLCLVVVCLFGCHARRPVSDAEFHRRMETFAARIKSLPTLDQTEAFPAEYRDAVVAVAKAIEAAGEAPAEYHPEIARGEQGTTLVFCLWSRTVYSTGRPLMIGHGLTVTYDCRKQEVSSILGWQ